MTQNINSSDNINHLDEKDITKTDVYKKIIHSIETNNLPEVKRYIEHGLDINADHGYFLQKASHNGYLSIVQFLVNAGADISLKNFLAFRWATREGHIDVVKFFLQQNINVSCHNNYAFHAAITNGHTEIVDLLCSKGLQINLDCEQFKHIIKSGHLNAIKYLFNIQHHQLEIKKYINTLFAFSCCYDNIDIISFLLNKGADIHFDDELALSNAIQNKIPNVVQYLINKGADIYTKQHNLLSKAVICDNFFALKLLIESHQNHLILATTTDNSQYQEYLLKQNDYFELEKTLALKVSVERLDQKFFDYLIKQKTDIFFHRHSVFRALVTVAPIFPTDLFPTDDENFEIKTNIVYYMANYIILNYGDKKIKYLISAIETAYRYKHIDQEHKDFWIKYVNSLVLNKKLTYTLNEEQLNHLKQSKNKL